ncbi:hypothetical protein K435DRAFT_851464 [Dendrothele bispora CBS 962.96]|uniref:Uncharacterized protein n=1 Tax=Dendrothele bispora (strain CBS 962.96) TaxID=1314807 RepID=A0A4S8MLS3_DENBC|nr:hypothetical protein K435DRAFT_851464 [Dendrothele bispora CBS 962.96]
MIPRHANPHFSQAFSVETVSRKALLRDDSTSLSDLQVPEMQKDQALYSNSDVDEEERSILLRELDERILGEFELEMCGPESKRDSGLQDEEAEPKERRRKRKKNNTKTEIAKFSFRLFSGAEKLIFLEPGPSKPPSCYREPAYEDTPSEALRRRERAQSVAVDYAWILNESRKECKPFPSTTSRLIYGTIKEPRPSAQGVKDVEDPWPPATLIVRRLQPIRGTRPPVPRTMLKHHPYMRGAEPLVAEVDPDSDRQNEPYGQKATSSGSISRVDLVTSHGDESNRRRRRRRRRASATGPQR